MARYVLPPGAPGWLYVPIVIALSLVFLLGALLWMLLAINGKAMPDGLAAIVGAIGGGLVATLATSGGTSNGGSA